MICDECETVAHCLKNGCVPKQPSKDEVLKLALEALEKWKLLANGDSETSTVVDGCHMQTLEQYGTYLERLATAKDANTKAITAIKQALSDAAHLAAPVQHPVESPDDWSDWKVTPPAAQPTTEKSSAVQPVPVQDAEGENMAVRSFLMLYGQRGVTVGEMKRHMGMSGFKSWPTWVDADEMAKHHLTKAGAQLWIRHLFALEATQPADEIQRLAALVRAQQITLDKLEAVKRQWVGLSAEEREQHRDDWHSNIHDKEFRAIEAKLKEKNCD
jgi:hypothetical protein